jgi:hypothetical protein
VNLPNENQVITTVTLCMKRTRATPKGLKTLERVKRSDPNLSFDFS